MMRTLLIFVCATFALQTAARAEIVEFALDGATTPSFEKTFRVQPKKIAEACVPLTPDTTVAWSFESTAATKFNIHYHVGKDVRYVENQNATARASASFRAPSAQTYCWMWTNTAATATEIKFRVSRAP